MLLVEQIAPGLGVFGPLAIPDLRGFPSDRNFNQFTRL